MALATRCTACTTVFRISTAQAAAKGGMVRCGVCRNVFNSLDALVRVEELDVVEEVVIATTANDEAVPGQAKSSVEAFDALDEDDETAAAVDEPADRVAPGVLGDRAMTRAWWLPEMDSQRPTSGGPATGGRIDTTGTRPLTAAMMVSDRDGDLAPEATSIDSTHPIFMQPDRDTEAASSTLHWTLHLLSIVAALALLGQLAYFWRDELAARWTPARPWLTAACERLGCAVGYPVHAASITIESASVQTSAQGANVYGLTALLRNRDTIDVRYPHLELVLTDLQDQPILRRDLRPEDYLPAGRAPSTGFPAESELPIRVAFELNNLHFAGYRLNQYYP